MELRKEYAKFLLVIYDMNYNSENVGEISYTNKIPYYYQNRETFYKYKNNNLTDNVCIFNINRGNQSEVLIPIFLEFEKKHVGFVKLKRYFKLDNYEKYISIFSYLSNLLNIDAPKNINDILQICIQSSTLNKKNFEINLEKNILK